MNTESLIPTLRSLFQVCSPLESSKDAIRCERKYKDQTRAVYFFRGSSTLPGPDEIKQINEEVLSYSYFRSSDASRWNHYFIIVTDDEAVGGEAFFKAKQAIEADKSYARKFVVPESELSAFIGGAIDERTDKAPSKSILDEWLSRLNSVGLGAIGTDRARSAVIREFRSGTAPHEARGATELAQISRLSAQVPAPRMLTSVTINRFGERRLSGTYPFKRVNLIFGPNGAGKTSLLESIEHLFCGATYRSGGKSEDLDAVAFFEQGNSHSYRPLTNAEAQGRDQHWYGHTVLRGNKLCQGFARFNFLNTDAAVEFSRDNELQNLTDALSKIALGPEATFTWDRIVAFEQDISAQLNTLENELSTLNGSIQRNESRLAALQTVSPQAEVLTRQFRDSLSALAWPDTEIPEVPGSDWFSHFLPLKGLVNASEAIAPIASAEKLGAAIDDLSSDLKDISLLEAEKRSEATVARDVTSRRSKLVSVRKLCERQAEYLSAKFIEAVDEEKTLRDSRAALTTSVFEQEVLTNFADVAASLGCMQRPVMDFVVAVNRELENLRDKISIAESRRIDLDRQLAASKSIVAEIRALGRAYADASPGADHCPLCRTQMEMSELVSRLGRELGHDAKSAELELLKTAKAKLEKNAKQLSDALATARAIGEAHRERSYSSIEELLGFIRQANEESQSTAARLEQVRWRVSMLEGAGFTVNEYTRVLSAISDWLSDQSLDLSPEASRADLLSFALLAEESKLADEERALEGRTKERRRRESVLFDRYSLPDMGLLRDHLQQKLAQLKAFQERLGSLPAATRSRYSGDLSGLIAAARDATARLDELSSQIQGERSRNAETSLLLQQLAVDEQQSAMKNGERNRLADALNVLHDIQSNLSLDSGLSAHMRENLDSIQRIFTKIHVPHELKISDLSGCRLERLDSNRVAELNQISTGQRAALMLSIFISLNVSLKNGPPYMLIDDPIAHVDDLNVLSFLDLLADIAEIGHRQIFFATANEKLAHLFQKKMEFLGADFHTLDMTRDFAAPLVADEGATQH